LIWHDVPVVSQKSTTEPPDAALHACARYPVIVLPPFDVGALHRAVMDVSATVALTLVGAVGTPALVVPATREESELAPAGADTWTATQYCVFPLRLPIAQEVDDVVQELTTLPPVSAL
jgi:hypothetical protein